MAGTVIGTILILMFLSVGCAYVVGELRKRTGLRNFARIPDVPFVIMAPFPFNSVFWESIMVRVR